MTGPRYYEQSYPPSIFEPPVVDPSITSLAPTTGTVGVAGRVTVTGSNFETDSVIEVDQAPVSTIYVSATELYTDYTPTSAGTKRFTVRNANDEESNGADFTVSAAEEPEPEVDSISGLRVVLRSVPAGTVIAWGDGSDHTYQAKATPAHTYGYDGSYTITVTLPGRSPVLLEVTLGGDNE